MKKLVAEVAKRLNNWASLLFYCLDEDELVDSAVTCTLLEFIELAHLHDVEIESSLSLVEAGLYVPENPAWGDWGFNDVDLWFLPPMAKPGHICIANENMDNYSTAEGGEPQQFTYEQIKVALKHWREFRERVAKEGKESLVGQRFEVFMP